ncbi:hypothetical protein PMIN03_008993 [Paraphaeosphaeria minitans]|uniref:Dimethylaniline monooxygenase 2 n=1 Tax=Paraphaeosphaeria minitans TaxID=565426 RepID=A0A9P6KUQ6_9PLEO|nr:dimethylaniline monooxygenase 2 [Paraphaeosphaeria minitans]
MAVSNDFRGAHPLPSLCTLEPEVDAHHTWLATRWDADRTDGSFDRSMVRNWEFRQGFLNEAAGTGMESPGRFVKGWMSRIKYPKMSWVMNHGVETTHAVPQFDTGTRTWQGARDAIIRAIEAVNGRFPIKGEGGSA